jgi:hypothetical protein
MSQPLNLLNDSPNQSDIKPANPIPALGNSVPARPQGNMGNNMGNNMGYMNSGMNSGMGIGGMNNSMSGMNNSMGGMNSGMNNNNNMSNNNNNMSNNNNNMGGMTGGYDIGLGGNASKNQSGYANNGVKRNNDYRAPDLLFDF